MIRQPLNPPKKKRFPQKSMIEKNFFHGKVATFPPVQGHSLLGLGISTAGILGTLRKEAGRLQTEGNQPFVQGLHLLLEDQADLPVLKGLAHPNINKK